MREALLTQSARHAELLAAWYDALPILPLADLDPARTALACVDAIEGFHRVGPLASERVAAVIPDLVDLVERLGAAGVPDDHVCFVQDAHPADAEEFGAYPPHCVAGTEQAEAVAELRTLPRWSAYVHATKNSIASHQSDGFRAWLEPLDVGAVVAIGDVTDLCLFSLALHLQTRSQERGLEQRVIVPASCVQTWDAPDHPGDLYHVLFLHQLARNGVEVVRSIA